MKVRRYITTTAVCFLLSLPCFGDTKATTEDGRKVMLRDNGTWEEVKEPADDKGKKISYAEEAVTVWDTTLIHSPADSQTYFNDRVALAVHYKNNTSKRVTGVIIQVKIDSPLGRTLLERTWEDEVVLEPFERKKNDVFWTFEDNPYINDQPYDNLWRVAQNGTAKITTRIMKVVCEDGTVFNPRPAPTPKAKK